LCPAESCSFANENEIATCNKGSSSLLKIISSSQAPGGGAKNRRELVK